MAEEGGGPAGGRTVLKGCEEKGGCRGRREERRGSFYCHWEV